MLVGLEQHDQLKKLIKNRKSPLDSDLETDDNLNAWMRRDVTTGHHISGTAKMGPDTDGMAVVNQFGRVYGVDGLRVADASIMPDCIRVNKCR
jgi:choline dehydrogenase